MVIIYSKIFKQFPEIIFGFSTKAGEASDSPYGFNISYSVGDDEKKVRENRERFLKEIAIIPENTASQKQIHSDIITYVDKPGSVGESDALFTDKRSIGLIVTVADCTPIFLFDTYNKVIAAVHSGWRGTRQNILGKTINKLIQVYNSKPENIFAYIGASICQKCYEVGPEVAKQFDSKYLLPNNDKFLLDVRGNCYDTLLQSGIPKEQIEVSDLCTYEQKELLHSYRRDGKLSGRMMGVIALK